MNQFSKVFLGFVVCCLPLFSLAEPDTNMVNKWNDQALDLAYSDPAEAMKVAKKSLAAARKIHFNRGEVRALIRMGIIYDVTSLNTKAIKMYKKSLELSYETHDERGVASNLNNLGLIYYKTNHYHTSLKYFNRAHTIFSKLGDQINIGSVCNNIGLLYEELHRYKSAVSWFRKALVHYQKANEKFVIYDAYSNLGNAYSNMSDIDKAIYYTQLSIDGYLKTENHYGLGISYSNLGVMYRRKKQYDKSVTAFEASIRNSEEIGNEYSIVSATYNLAGCYRLLRNEPKSFELLKSIYPLLKEADSKELGFKVCYDLANAYFLRNDNQMGTQMLRQYKNDHQSYSNETLNRTLLEAQDLFQTKEIQQKADFKIKEEQHKRFNDNLLWSAVFIVFVLLALLIFYIFRKSNLQKELAAKNAIFEATFEERRRISYDLHDLVGSQLSYVVNNLELMQHSIKGDERIDRTFNMSQAAMSSLRDTVWTLHTEEITVDLLSQRMENVLRKMLESHRDISAEITVTAPTSIVLTAQATMHVMLIFQEAIHNVVKHAKATKVNVLLEEVGDQFVLSIADNGIGFVKTEIQPFHYGLQSMKERAAKIDGNLDISDSPEGGTTVRLTWKNNPNA